MKKFAACILILLLVCTLSACNYVDTYTTVDSYPEFFKLSGRWIIDEMYYEYNGMRYLDFKSLLFPDSITQLNVKEYYCIYNHNERFEVLLSIAYSEEAYLKEIERLSSVIHNGKILYTTDHFEYPAYVTALGYNECSEYALLDEEQHVIHYVYLQAIRLKDIKMPSLYLPKKLRDYGDVEGICFTIYNTEKVYVTVPQGTLHLEDETYSA